MRAPERCEVGREIRMNELEDALWPLETAQAVLGEIAEVGPAR